jgi:hypothetical protein
VEEKLTGRGKQSLYPTLLVSKITMGVYIKVILQE